ICRTHGGAGVVESPDAAVGCVVRPHGVHGGFQAYSGRLGGQVGQDLVGGSAVGAHLPAVHGQGDAAQECHRDRSLGRFGCLVFQDHRTAWSWFWRVFVLPLLLLVLSLGFLGLGRGRGGGRRVGGGRAAAGRLSGGGV